jgi:dihydrofolate reductase
MFAAFLATSLDGYIARRDGSIDWLEKANALVSSGEDCGYSEFFSSIDCIVLGRKSFDKVMSFPEWPYVGKKVYVLSRLGIQRDAAELPPGVSVVSASVANLAQMLQEKGHRKVYVDGGEVVRQFIQSGLLDELTITRIPVLIHKGTRLFDDFNDDETLNRTDVWLELTNSCSWPFGFTQEKWSLRKTKSP